MWRAYAISLIITILTAMGTGKLIKITYKFIEAISYSG